MRLFLPLCALACLLVTSCAKTGALTGSYTRADYANLRLRDLNPLAGAPPIVQVQQSTLREISADRRSFLERRFAWFRKPVDYQPPTLPDGALAFDGALLPPKAPGEQAATTGIDGLLADPRLAALESEDEHEFSIE